MSGVRDSAEKWKYSNVEISVLVYDVNIFNSLYKDLLIDYIPLLLVPWWFDFASSLELQSSFCAISMSSTISGMSTGVSISNFFFSSYKFFRRFIFSFPSSSSEVSEDEDAQDIGEVD